MTHTSRYRQLTALLLLFGLASCGGGGGGGDPSDAPAQWDNTNWDQVKWQ